MDKGSYFSMSISLKVNATTWLEFHLTHYNVTVQYACPYANLPLCYTLITDRGNAGGARDVMVIIVGNGHGDTDSNPGRDCLHFT